jgi:hypothetical protein
MMENGIHDRGIDGINRRNRIQRLRSLATFHKPDGISPSTAKVVIDYKARFAARSQCLHITSRKLSSIEGTHHEPPGAPEFRDNLTQCHASNDFAESHLK